MWVVDVTIPPDTVLLEKSVVQSELGQLDSYSRRESFQVQSRQARYWPPNEPSD